MAKKNSKPAQLRALKDYSTKELVREIKTRVQTKQSRLKDVLLPLERGDPVTTQELKNRLAELDLVKSLAERGRAEPYKNNELRVEERLAEKVWWWLSELDAKESERWAHIWKEKHPAESVGTKNVSTREAWLKKTLKKVPAGSKILDAGAGELQFKKFCKHLDYVSQDFGQYTGEGDVGLQIANWDNSKLDIISDIGNIPVKDKSFDAIMCIEVFEHIPKPIDAVKEFSRILKRGGTLIITTPFCALTHFAPYFFYNGYSRYFYETILAEHGFEIKEITFNGNYFEYLAQELRRVDEIAARYSPEVTRATPLEDLMKYQLLRRLEKLSENDEGSSELLVQGVQVVATKK